MSELFISHLLCYLVAIIMFTIALKLSCNHSYFMKNLVSVKNRVYMNEYGADIKDYSENIKRLSSYCNWIIAICVAVFFLTYFSYVFNLFDTVPVNPMKY